MSSLSGKRVLFIAPHFFGYECEVVLSLKEQGAIVDYFNERPQNSFLMKTVLRFKKSYIKTFIERYYKKIIAQTEDKVYDFIFVLNAEAITDKIMSKIKAKHKNAVAILYMWDSISNKRNVIHLLPLFDRIFSFDHVDADAFKEIEFLSLFFIPQYNVRPHNTIKYDVSFIGTAHSDRFAVLEKIKNQLQSFNLKYFFFLYLQNPIMLVYLKLTSQEFVQARFADFNYDPMSQTSTADIIHSSSVIVDISHPKQTGLTMRSFEVLGAKKKLITTNQQIKHFDFYNEDNICIIDRHKPIIDINFCKSPYKDLSVDVYQKYSIANWTSTIFGGFKE